jgi:hypothetical protein
LAARSSFVCSPAGSFNELVFMAGLPGHTILALIVIPGFDPGKPAGAVAGRPPRLPPGSAAPRAAGREPRGQWPTRPALPVGDRPRVPIGPHSDWRRQTSSSSSRDARRSGGQPTTSWSIGRHQRQSDPSMGPGRIPLRRTKL